MFISTTDNYKHLTVFKNIFYPTVNSSQNIIVGEKELDRRKSNTKLLECNITVHVRVFTLLVVTIKRPLSVC